MSDYVSNLQANQVKALESLAAGASIDEAASAAGVTVRTVYRWRTMPDFAGALRAANAEGLRELARVVAASSLEAVQYLRAVIDDTAAPHGVRIRAAGQLLSVYPRLYELVSLQEQLDDIERRLDAANL